MKMAATFIASIFLSMTASAADVPTFNKDIAPILYQHCATCHRPGEVAPFSLLTYEDAAKRAKLIASATERRFMPPWKPEPGYGKFANERRLTDDQIALIRAWAQNGAPEGAPGDKPPLPGFTDGWQAGKPDQILTMPSSFAVASSGHDLFRCFLLPLNLDRDVYVSGTEFRPGNRRIVHHALVYVDTTGAARARAGRDGSYPCFGGPGVPGVNLIGGWVPGTVAQPPSKEFSRFVPKGSDVVVQIHYHASGKPESDQSSVGLIFSGPQEGTYRRNGRRRPSGYPRGRSALCRQRSTGPASGCGTRRDLASCALSRQGNEGHCVFARWHQHSADLDQRLGFQLAGLVSI